MKFKEPLLSYLEKGFSSKDLYEAEWKYGYGKLQVVMVHTKP